MIAVDPPGGVPLRLDFLLLDVNGTLADRGRMIDGVDDRIRRLSQRLEVHLLTADTFGTAGELAQRLGVRWQPVSSGTEKVCHAAALGPDRAAAIGNGSNDAALLDCAALGIAVIGPEGASVAALHRADIVCRSIVEALDVLLDPVVLEATLRP